MREKNPTFVKSIQNLTEVLSLLKSTQNLTEVKEIKKLMDAMCASLVNAALKLSKKLKV